MQEGTLLSTHPAEELLFYHLNEALGVHRVNVDVSLKSAIFGAPGQWFANNTVGSKLGETLVHGVEDRLVKNVLTLL